MEETPVDPVVRRSVRFERAVSGLDVLEAVRLVAQDLKSEYWVGEVQDALVPGVLGSYRVTITDDRRGILRSGMYTRLFANSQPVGSTDPNVTIKNLEKVRDALEARVNYG